MREIKVLFYLVCGCMLCGCVKRVTMPLCQAIALKSYAPGAPVAPGTVVNAFLAQQAGKEDIKLNVLSPVAVEVSGRKRKVVRLERNYPFLLCAFYGQADSTDYAKTYTTCMQSAPAWEQIIQSSKPDNLILPATNYAYSCIQNTIAPQAAPLTGGAIQSIPNSTHEPQQ
jgi:hypothetical protein